MDKNLPTGSIVNSARVPTGFPTHKHPAAFWESLGRAVGTFGFLEEVLGRAIFAFRATRPLDPAAAKEAYARWLPQLESALIDPLGNLIDAYASAVGEHPDATITNLDDLIGDLKKAARMRNILCHGSWRLPNEAGASLPLFVNRQRMVVDTAMDAADLGQVQRHAAELACAVINTVTSMGWQFPGSDGPGKPIWEQTPGR